MALATDPIPPIEEVQDLARAWSGTHVGFDFLTQSRRQFVAFYGANRHMTVASRPLGAEAWTAVELSSQVLWDSHNYVTLAVDRKGQLHVAGNMHMNPLVYFRTTAAGDVTSLRRLNRMLGRDESLVTYPQFMEGPAGELLFLYREGTSGNGRHFVNVYDPTRETWQRLFEDPLFSYRGAPMNAYPVGPVRGHGYYHLAWVWRDNADASSNHDLCYARSRDLIHWETSAGQPIELPMLLENTEVIDPVPAGGGIINGNTKLGFDASGRVIVSYHKFDSAGNTQIFNARREKHGWRIYRVTNWRERWDFGGRGTLDFKIKVNAVKVDARGALVQNFDHWVNGSGTWVLDATTLRPVAESPAADPIPAELRQASAPGLVAHIRVSRGDDREVNRSSFLHWETLPRNGDAAPAYLPAPSTLRLYRLGPAPGPIGCTRDRDGDGACDDADDCETAWNPDQIDSDGDGYGNQCDADYDNNGIVGAADFNRIRRGFGQTLGDPDYRAAADHDSDGRVTWADARFCARRFGRPPGPSGLACAGSVPCP